MATEKRLWRVFHQDAALCVLDILEKHVGAKSNDDGTMLLLKRMSSGLLPEQLSSFLRKKRRELNKSHLMKQSVEQRQIMTNKFDVLARASRDTLYRILTSVNNRQQDMRLVHKEIEARSRKLMDKLNAEEDRNQTLAAQNYGFR